MNLFNNYFLPFLLTLVMLLLGSLNEARAQTLEFALSAGSGAFDAVQEIDVDDLGNSYVVGQFKGKVDLDRGSVESQLWRDFVNGDRTKLPDFSYAGYERGEASIPDVTWKVYNIIEYGANPSPNTGGSQDLNAFKDVIKAIPNSQHAIIYFPEGTYDIGNSSSMESYNLIRIERGNIVLRGAGSDKSIIKLKIPPATESAFIRKISILHPNVKDSRITDITSDGKLGDFSVVVASTTGLKVNKWVKIKMVSPDNNYYSYLSPYSRKSSWDYRLHFTERHKIKSISGKRVTFYEPILIPYIKASEGDSGKKWALHNYDHIENVGVEDLGFRGDWGPGDPYWPFVHHDPKSRQYDDYAHHAFHMYDVANGWIRRCKFMNFTNALWVENSVQISYLENEVSQDRYSGKELYGHHDIQVRSCNHCLFGVSVTTAKMRHGPTINGWETGSGGNVLWRYKWHRERGHDFHRYTVWSSLIDLSEGGLRRTANTGSGTANPNHLKHFVLWNHNNTDPTRGDYADDTREYDYYNLWSDKGYFVTPIAVGVHGQPVRYLTKGTGRVDVLEHNGRSNVTPRSLYEAMLSHRLGYLPAWVCQTRGGRGCGEENTRPAKPTGLKLNVK